ncbi:GH1 family beta-glucosidase [Chitinivibrio alkaliphilus]|uniref:Beta-glucosidase n=1 Tax=Chitinivibrio alkaliphilus ACht1 TaxID=1313304 RepID=U7DA26_9BACT|nr:GH1 family beta-glucosidase [Chitinivibrio alkaliphilus]ERP38852.1 beta-glucosidase [Chitinivibrio alkaliphilus ACht1]
MSFPDSFLWGASTAAYQIEGAAATDGRGASVWDAFCRKPGAVVGGETGDVACDHYNRYADDIALWASLGLQSYRFSLSWSRLFPHGRGRVNSKGVDFYNRVIDTLLFHNITPVITLFHWDFPLDLFYQGGWLHRDSAYWFADYAAFAAQTFGDRVTWWITQNEPQCFIELGHKTGYHAPGLSLPQREVLWAAHNSLRAHGCAYGQMKEVRNSLMVGYGPVGVTSIPQEETSKNIMQARHHMFSHTDESLFTNTWFMDPVFKGEYPEDGCHFYGTDMIEFHSSDMEEIHQGADFLGTNIYHGTYINDTGGEVAPPQGHSTTAMGWPITPRALYWGPRFLSEQYGVPLVVTENGMAGTDYAMPDDTIIEDPYRVAYLRQYLQELRRACREGVDVRGYFVWSALDNFEWAEGYGKRFGIVYVDYETQERFCKRSALWYKEVIESNGRNL